MKTRRELAVYDVAAELILLGRLDRKSEQELPARLTTLLRRVVDATPHELCRLLWTIAPPPKRAPAREYASALVELFQAYDALSAQRVRPAMQRIRDALGRLAMVTGSPPPSDATATRAVEDAFVWKAEGYRWDRTDEHVALAEVHVALAGEGHLRTGDAAMRAAAFLAVEASHRPDYQRATRYAASALRWGTEAHRWFPSPLADCVSILAEAGDCSAVVKLAPPLLEPYEPFDEIDTDVMQPPETYTAYVVQVGSELARALAELGALDDAMTYAADALWRAIRRFGPDHPLTLSCQSTYADRLFAANRDADGVAMMRPVFESLRRRSDEDLDAYIYTGITLAFGLDRIGERAEARAISNQIAAEATRRLPREHPALRHAQQTQRVLESRS
jgi:hypothetical protein